MQKTLLAALAGAALLAAQPSQACTVWAAAGQGFVKDGGVLVTKVRDEQPYRQTFEKRKRPDAPYTYIGLCAGTSGHFNTGINEKGLFIGRTTSGSIPKKIRSKTKPWYSSDHLLPPEYLLSRCASVDEVLAHKEVFTGRPSNYILADPKTIAFVELMPGDKGITVRIMNRGELAHTNHFIEKASVDSNIKIGESSQARYNRICELQRNHRKPYTMDDFIAMSHDRSAGPDNSIFRTGQKSKSRTLAIETVHFRRDGKVEFSLEYQPDPKNSPEWKKIREVWTLPALAPAAAKRK